MKYTITVVQTYSKMFDIEANSLDDAAEFIRNNLGTGKFVIDENDLDNRRMHIVEHSITGKRHRAEWQLF